MTEVINRMVKEAFGVAPTIEQAYEAAKSNLAAPEDAQVLFEVLEQPKKKTFGLFGGSDAKVRAYYEVKDETPVVTKPEKKVVQEKKADPVKKKEQPKAKAKTVAADTDPVLDYLTSIIKGMGVSGAEIERKENEEEILYEIKSTDDYGVLIGHHGDTLDAIQYLVRLYANKRTNEEKRISLNAGDYREKRAENLRTLAKRNANQVLKFGRSAKLEPMSAYERRIIHTAVQQIEGVSSHSVGSGADRRVIITLDEGVTPTVADKRRQGNRGSQHGGRNSSGRSQRNGRSTYQPSGEARAPRSDFESGSHYGKIDVSSFSQSK